MRARTRRAARYTLELAVLITLSSVIGVGAGLAFIHWPIPASIVAAAASTHWVGYRAGVARERERGRVAVRLAAHLADEAETSGAIRRRLAQAAADAEQPPHIQSGGAS